MQCGVDVSPTEASPFPDPGARVIEVAPPDRSVYEDLRAAGCTRYLALTTGSSDGAAAADEWPSAPLTSPDLARAHNADVLILHGDFARFLWYRRLGWARFVAFPADGAAAREARLASRLHRRERLPRVTWGGRAFDVVRMPHPGQEAARHYLSPLVPLATLPRLLDERGLRYVVLRWFEHLPAVEPGEDLDVLVADEDLDGLVELLDEQPGTVPVDVYSSGGRPGADFQAMAYYPPALATGMLERAAVLPSGYRAPAPEDHFLSLGYHALYHKGVNAGLPFATETSPPTGAAEHAYPTILAELGARHGVDGPLTMERLDEHLAARGWRPPRDMLAKLSQHNAWVRDRFFADAALPIEPPLLSAFLLRDRAADEASVELTRQVLSEHGFDIVHTHVLDDAARERCAREVRGGNWGRGPFPTSGGEPAVLLVALDDRPEAPTPAQQREHPGLANARTLLAKLDARDRLLASVPAAERFNPMHSSDSDEDGWHYVELADPDAVARLHAVVDRRRTELAGRPAAEVTAPPEDRRRALATRVRLGSRAAAGRLRRRGKQAAAGLLRWGLGRRVASTRRA
jgi:hypothetical protein